MLICQTNLKFLFCFVLVLFCFHMYEINVHSLILTQVVRIKPLNKTKIKSLIAWHMTQVPVRQMSANLQKGVDFQLEK